MSVKKILVAIVFSCALTADLFAKYFFTVTDLKLEEGVQAFELSALRFRCNNIPNADPKLDVCKYSAAYRGKVKINSNDPSALPLPKPTITGDFSMVTCRAPTSTEAINLGGIVFQLPEPTFFICVETKGFYDKTEIVDSRDDNIKNEWHITFKKLDEGVQRAAFKIKNLSKLLPEPQAAPILKVFPPNYIIPQVEGALDQYNEEALLLYNSKGQATGNSGNALKLNDEGLFDLNLSDGPTQEQLGYLQNVRFAVHFPSDDTPAFLRASSHQSMPKKVVVFVIVENLTIGIVKQNVVNSETETSITLPQKIYCVHGTTRLVSQYADKASTTLSIKLTITCGASNRVLV